MANYTANFLRMLRNQVPIDEVVGNLLNLELRNTADRFRFRCPLCSDFHTATNQETNLARCFDCQKNFNPIDLVMTVANCSFLDAVELLKNRINQ
jgi:DNA primase